MNDRFVHLFADQFYEVVSKFRHGVGLLIVRLPKPFDEGWFYLAVILDLLSSSVIGLAVSNRMKRDVAVRALKMAIAFRAPPKGCVHHTDRGSQYCYHN